MFFGLKMAMEIANKNQHVLAFDNVAVAILNMEPLFRLSMEEDSELYQFLSMDSSKDYREDLSTFCSEMRQHLSKEREVSKDKDSPALKRSQFETYINAFRHIVPTRGYSMSQYLDAENPALGQFLEKNIKNLQALNKVFMQYLKHQPVVQAMHR